MEDKKLFLLNASLLYNELLKQTKNDCLKRFLAFKIVLNEMSYEDLIRKREFKDLREIRNVFLAHKQEGNFFEAFNASEKIIHKNIMQLIYFMIINLETPFNYKYYPELIDRYTNKKLKELSCNILNKFEKKYYAIPRLNNNFLCTQANQIKEISSNPLASVAYRYNSSLELSKLANYFISNLINKPQFEMAFLNFKMDYILHAVNMYDCTFKDAYNRHSIDGLYEVMQTLSIGNINYIQNLLNDTNFNNEYKMLKNIRNHLAGHMDNQQNLKDLLNEIRHYDIIKAFDFINKLHLAIEHTAMTHLALKSNYIVNMQPINNSNIIDTEGFQNIKYLSGSNLLQAIYFQFKRLYKIIRLKNK